MPEKVVHLFDQMLLKADAVILMLFFNACADLVNEHAKKRGREVLKQLPRALLNNDKLMRSAVDMLMKFGDVDEAEQVFHSMKTKSVFTYAAMMKGN
jgi:pentatricopeptide repeat protein